jgi:hypothetical protein
MSSKAMYRSSLLLHGAMPEGIWNAVTDYSTGKSK